MGSMKFKFYILTSLVGLTVLTTAKADDYFASGLLGVANSGKQSLSETKLLNTGMRSPLLFGLTQQMEIGGWADNVQNGRKSSAYGAYLIGVEAKRDVVARAMVGPALITNPDSYLGGPFQFTEDFYFGLSGDNGNSVGIKYKHISSAGLEQPNEGRDFAGIEVSLPF